MVFARVDVLARVEAVAALADDDLTRLDGLACEKRRGGGQMRGTSKGVKRVGRSSPPDFFKPRRRPADPRTFLVDPPPRLVAVLTCT